MHGFKTINNNSGFFSFPIQKRKHRLAMLSNALPSCFCKKGEIVKNVILTKINIIKCRVSKFSQLVRKTGKIHLIFFRLLSKHVP